MMTVHADPSTRSLRAIRDACDDALAGGPAGAGVELMSALLKRRSSIDPETAALVLRCMTSVLAATSGDTPGTILRGELDLAPSDPFWHADLSGAFDARQPLDAAS
jgi:hypothetical protein